MNINEDLKKDVDKKASILRDYTFDLSKTQDIIDRILLWLHITIVFSISILFIYYLKIVIYTNILLVLLIIFSLLSLGLRVKLQKIRKQYDNIYNNSFDIMSELADLTEWTKLRKRYVLGKKDYRDIIIIDNYIETIERKFSPHRSISNYYKLLSIESSIFIYSIIVISIVEIYKCLFI